MEVFAANRVMRSQARTSELDFDGFDLSSVASGPPASPAERGGNHRLCIPQFCASDLAILLASPQEEEEGFHSISSAQVFRTGWKRKPEGRNGLVKYVSCVSDLFDKPLHPVEIPKTAPVAANHIPYRPQRTEILRFGEEMCQNIRIAESRHSERRKTAWLHPRRHGHCLCR